ncbi:hypothetical protein EDM22_12350 [Agromyces tardus]|uniref:N-acetyltransferase domain-containing protein n=1 Tax=Agromyces tardus TaxID=2583849 RepID=A0A3M8AA94_9MICO|nr:hypothetical protein [Agromyces tardus]RNB47415.1 hypothetical protein EDM22_12350 [Agromyces tardus]
MLDWHSATQDHRNDLSLFRCTDPATVSFDEERGFECHDFPWELRVQDHINTELIPPLHAPSFLDLGFDEDGLAAVVEMTVSEFDRGCFIHTLAVAHRVSGRGIAGEAIDRAPILLARYDISRDFIVEGLIDRDNIAAQSAFGRHGFEHSGYRNGCERWARLYP